MVQRILAVPDQARQIALRQETSSRKASGAGVVIAAIIGRGNSPSRTGDQTARSNRFPASRVEASQKAMGFSYSIRIG
jgi:hypothetical protein